MGEALDDELSVGFFELLHCFTFVKDGIKRKIVDLQNHLRKMEAVSSGFCSLQVSIFMGF